MKGGINKLMRNITATSAKTDFEKVPSLILINLTIETDQSYLPHGFQRAQGKTRHL